MTARKPQRKSEKGEPFMTATIQVDPSAVDSIPLRVVCDSSTSLCQHDDRVSGNMACVLGVGKKDTIEGAVRNLLIDEVSILCLPQRTSNVV
ncbi:hypothetical protein T03_6172 [Trichinella britovi]|uniref:Peptidase aspartic putative domain-containing protein n=1 Tax=Trichinella britovi TaxID=45882 RepID=A0A0V1CEW8_TRIBR|nr:hypothetical protein T03_6172 [Trichinella britovi]